MENLHEIVFLIAKTYLLLLGQLCFVLLFLLHLFQFCQYIFYSFLVFNNSSKMFLNILWFLEMIFLQLIDLNIVINCHDHIAHTYLWIWKNLFCSSLQNLSWEGFLLTANLSQWIQEVLLNLHFIFTIHLD
jgi:hypothetical protein